MGIVPWMAYSKKTIKLLNNLALDYNKIKFDPKD